MIPKRKIKKYFLIVFFIFLWFSLFTPMALAEGVDNPPPGASQEEHSFSLGAWLISLYSKHISAVDGDRCPSFPSCSTYSARAFKKHGFFMGWMMTVDRLFHEGKEETKVSPLIFSEGKWKIYDPVENNDFWWDFPD
ncbi:MAG: membrane protein insertion efficiency factor YidD, partial [Deltaproteobacteria bacterium]|nr:membrane protein insertion efficiency factor YidD [Deltaproteobacteria bacterium]